MSLDQAKHERSDVPAPEACGMDNSTPPPSVEASQRGRARASARQSLLASRFANVVGVLMRDPNFRNLRLADLEWLVIPPVLAGQCRLAHTAVPGGVARSQQSDMLVPVAVALWASVSAEIDARLAATLDKPVELSPTEWTSGDNLWLMAIAGDRRAVPTFLGQLEAQDFKDKSVKLRARSADGQTEILTVGTYRDRLTRAASQAKARN